MKKQIKQDTSYFYDGVKVADMAALEITSWLESSEYNVAVHNVESNKNYQAQDIDLVWLHYRDDNFKTSETVATTLEIKSDTYNSPNFFLEVISNNNKNTLGCFLQTKSDYLYYYFINKKILYSIPTKEAQNWYYDKLKKGHEFKYAYVPTKDKKGNVLYKSKGALVNIKQMTKEVDIKVYDLNPFLDSNLIA